MKNTFGFTSVRSTAALAAPWFVGAALGLDVLSTFYAGDEPLLVARLTITPQGGLHGLAMHDLAARTRVLAIRRAADKAILEHPPRRSTRFRPDDEAYLIGPYSELLTVLRRDRPTPEAPQPPGSSPCFPELLVPTVARLAPGRAGARPWPVPWCATGLCLRPGLCLPPLSRMPHEPRAPAPQPWIRPRPRP